MDESGFRYWLVKHGYSSKIISDNISRVKRFMLETNLGTDELNCVDSKKFLDNLFRHGGQELKKKFPNTKLPVNKYSLSTYKLAVLRYVNYLRDQEDSRQVIVSDLANLSP